MQVLDAAKVFGGDAFSYKIDRHCIHCGQYLNKFVWLELNCRTGLYSDPDVSSIKPDDSQGLFQFGPACAKGILKRGGKLK